MADSTGSAPSVSAPLEPAVPGDTDEDEFTVYEVDTASLTSSVLRHTYENGRRYHQFKHGRYPIPNDDAEQDREDMKHAMFLEVTDGKLFFAPIGDSPQRIIDVGTGTGLWAVDVADQFPSAEVIGTDLSPIQPNWTPPNVKFIVDDAEDTWIHGDNFDLVHLRHTVAFFKAPQQFLNNTISHIKPGGWIELQEFGGYLLCDDDTLPEDDAFRLFMTATREAFSLLGMDFAVGTHMRRHLEEAGFVNISKRVFKAPTNPWPRNKTMRLIGYYMAETFQPLITVMCSKALRVLGWDEQRLDDLMNRAKEDLWDRKVHAYLNYFFWTAQRPAGGQRSDEPWT